MGGKRYHSRIVGKFARGGDVVCRKGMGNPQAVENVAQQVLGATGALRVGNALKIVVEAPQLDTVGIHKATDALVLAGAYGPGCVVIQRGVLGHESAAREHIHYAEGVIHDSGVNGFASGIFRTRSHVPQHVAVIVLQPVDARGDFPGHAPLAERTHGGKRLAQRALTDFQAHAVFEILYFIKFHFWMSDIINSVKATIARLRSSRFSGLSG